MHSKFYAYIENLRRSAVKHHDRRSVYPPGYMHLYKEFPSIPHIKVNLANGEVFNNILWREFGQIDVDDYRNTSQLMNRFNNIIRSTCACCGTTQKSNIKFRIVYYYSKKVNYMLKGPPVCRKCKKYYVEKYPSHREVFLNIDKSVYATILEVPLPFNG